jgi:hypothetical protein
MVMVTMELQCSFMATVHVAIIINTPLLCKHMKSKNVNCMEHSIATAAATTTADLAQLHEVLLRPGSNAPHCLERACALVTPSPRVIQAYSSCRLVARWCRWDHRHVQLTLHHTNTHRCFCMRTSPLSRSA